MVEGQSCSLNMSVDKDWISCPCEHKNIYKNKSTS